MNTRSKKRSSILKKPVSVGFVDSSPTITFQRNKKKSINFSETNTVKEFIIGDDKNTIWGNSYEENNRGMTSSSTSNDDTSIKSVTVIQDINEKENLTPYFHNLSYRENVSMDMTLTENNQSCTMNLNSVPVSTNFHHNEMISVKYPSITVDSTYLTKIEASQTKENMFNEPELKTDMILSPLNSYFKTDNVKSITHSPRKTIYFNEKENISVSICSPSGYKPPSTNMISSNLKNKIVFDESMEISSDEIFESVRNVSNRQQTLVNDKKCATNDDNNHIIDKENIFHRSACNMDLSTTVKTMEDKSLNKRATICEPIEIDVLTPEAKKFNPEQRQTIYWNERMNLDTPVVEKSNTNSMNLASTKGDKLYENSNSDSVPVHKNINDNEKENTLNSPRFVCDMDESIVDQQTNYNSINKRATICDGIPIEPEVLTPDYIKTQPKTTINSERKTIFWDDRMNLETSLGKSYFGSQPESDQSDTMKFLNLNLDDLNNVNANDNLSLCGVSTKTPCSGWVFDEDDKLDVKVRDRRTTICDSVPIEIENQTPDYNKLGARPKPKTSSRLTDLCSERMNVETTVHVKTDNLFKSRTTMLSIDTFSNITSSMKYSKNITASEFSLSTDDSFKNSLWPTHGQSTAYVPQQPVSTRKTILMNDTITSEKSSSQVLPSVFRNLEKSNSINLSANGSQGTDKLGTSDKYVNKFTTLYGEDEMNISEMDITPEYRQNTNRRLTTVNNDSIVLDKSILNSKQKDPECVPTKPTLSRLAINNWTENEKKRHTILHNKSIDLDISPILAQPCSNIADSSLRPSVVDNRRTKIRQTILHNDSIETENNYNQEILKHCKESTEKFTFKKSIYENLSPLEIANDNYRARNCDTIYHNNSIDVEDITLPNFSNLTHQTTKSTESNKNEKLPKEIPKRGTIFHDASMETDNNFVIAPDKQRIETPDNFEKQIDDMYLSPLVWPEKFDSKKRSTMYHNKTIKLEDISESPAIKLSPVPIKMESFDAKKRTTTYNNDTIEIEDNVGTSAYFSKQRSEVQNNVMIAEGDIHPQHLMTDGKNDEEIEHPPRKTIYFQNIGMDSSDMELSFESPKAEYLPRKTIDFKSLKPFQTTNQSTQESSNKRKTEFLLDDMNETGQLNEKISKISLAGQINKQKPAKTENTLKFEQKPKENSKTEQPINEKNTEKTQEKIVPPGPNPMSDSIITLSDSSSASGANVPERKSILPDDIVELDKTTIYAIQSNDQLLENESCTILLEESASYKETDSYHYINNLTMETGSAGGTTTATSSKEHSINYEEVYNTVRRLSQTHRLTLDSSCENTDCNSESKKSFERYNLAFINDFWEKLFEKNIKCNSCGHNEQPKPETKLMELMQLKEKHNFEEDKPQNTKKLDDILGDFQLKMLEIEQKSKELVVNWSAPETFSYYGPETPAMEVFLKNLEREQQEFYSTLDCEEMLNEEFLNPSIFPLIPSYPELIKNRLEQYDSLWHLNDMHFPVGVLQFIYQHYKTFKIIVTINEEFINTLEALPYYFESIVLLEVPERINASTRQAIFHKEFIKSIESRVNSLKTLAPNSKQLFDMIEYLNSNISKTESLINHLYKILTVNGAMLIRNFDEFYVKKKFFQRVAGKITSYEVIICIRSISEIDEKLVCLKPALEDVMPKNSGLMFIEELFWNIHQKLGTI